MKKMWPTGYQNYKKISNKTPPAARAMCSCEWLFKILRILAVAYYVDLCLS